MASQQRQPDLYRPEINGLRAVAVLPVVFFHAGLPAFKGGFVGVDIFFVISGYLITSLILRERKAGTFSFISFFERRIRRLLPALYIVLLISCLFAYLFMMPYELRTFARSLMAVILFSANFYFNAMRNYFDDDTELYPLLHTWSLSAEEQFYLLFPFLFIWLLRFSSKTVAVLIGSLAVISFLVAQLGGNFSLKAPFVSADWSWWRGPAWGFFLLPTRAWELLAGAWLAIDEPRFQAHQKSFLGAQLLSCTGVGFIGFAFVYFDRETPFPSLFTLIPVLGSALIIRFASKGTIVHAVLTWPIFVWIGLISYSFYLWHQPLFAFARLMSLEPPSHGQFLVLSLVALALAYGTWALVEQPFRRKSVTRKQLALFIGSVSLVLVGFGLVGIQTKGMPERLPTKVQDVLAFRDYPHDRSARAFGCFLEPSKSFSDFSSACDAYGSSKIVLWGDSHAAALAVGLEAISIHSAQYTAASCPPLLDFEWKKSPHCREISMGVMEKIAQQQPRLVILHANWLQYDVHGFNLARISETIQSVKQAAPQAQIILLGGVPQWSPNLPNVIASRVLLGGSYLGGLRIKSASYAQLIARDEILAQAAASTRVNFISLLGKLCTLEGCIAVHDFDGRVEPAAYDYGHLTRSGAIYIARLIEPFIAQSP